MLEKDRYAIVARTSKPFPEALQALRDALKANGFGILWEIDVRATMKAKLGVDFADYVILGACNPPIAHQALTHEPNIGLLLPCNCIARAEGGEVILGAIEPFKLMDLTKRADLTPLACKIAETLEKVLEEAVK